MWCGTTARASSASERASSTSRNERTRPRIEDDGQQHAVVLAAAARTADEHRLPRIAAALAPRERLPATHVDLGELVDERAGPRALADPVGVAVRALVETGVVDPRKLEVDVGQLARRDTAPAGIDLQAPEADRGLAGHPLSHALEVQRVDDRAVAVGAQVEHDAVAAFVGVDVMEDEEWVHLHRGAEAAAAAAVDQVDARGLRALPAVVGDDRRPRRAGGSRAGRRRRAARRSPRTAASARTSACTTAPTAAATPARAAGCRARRPPGSHSAGRARPRRRSGRPWPGPGGGGPCRGGRAGPCPRRRGCAACAGRSARGWGSRCGPRSARRAPRSRRWRWARARGSAPTRPRRRSPGRVGRELGVLDAPVALPGAVRARAQEAVRVADASAPERERVQHRQPVEPVVEALAPDLEQRRSVAQQHAGKPRRHAALDGKLGQSHLLTQRGEAERVAGRPGRFGGERRQRPAGGEPERGSRPLTQDLSPRAGSLAHRPTIWRWPSEGAASFRPDAPADHPRGGAALGELDRARRDRGARRARVAGARRALRRLDRHVLAGQRQVRRLRRGLRLLRAVALRRGGDADARDDGARADPRARARGRGGGRAPLLHGHAGPRALASATSRRCWRARGWSPSTPTSSAAPRSATCPPTARSALRRPASSACTTTSRRRAATTPRSRPPSATRAACARSTRCARPAWRPASAASSTSARRREQRVEMAFELAEINPTSVPINLLNPRPGTKFGDRELHGPVGGRQVDRDLPPDPSRRAVPPVRRARREPRRAAAAGGQAGLNGVMMGNFLTTLGNEPERRPRDVRGARAQRRAPARQRRQPAARQPLGLARRARRPTSSRSYLGGRSAEALEVAASGIPSTQLRFEAQARRADAPDAARTGAPEAPTRRRRARAD